MRTLLRMFGVGLLCLGTAAAQGGGGDQPAVAFGSGSRMVQGTVTATSPDHLTVKTERGDSFNIAVTPNTQVRKGRDPEKLADIHVGDGVGAMGEIDQPNKTVHALMVFVVDAEQIKKARESLGKTTIAGRVTAIDELKLTVLRPDGVSQVIMVDEDTSFKKGGRAQQQGFEGLAAGGVSGGVGRGGSATAAGGESITLADVKVGSNVAGQGGLKGGVFVPTQLYVSEPGQGGRRRQAGAGGAAAVAPAGGPQK